MGFALGDGRRVRLSKAVSSVGSDAACDVVLDGRDVKPSHLLALLEAGGCSVVPAGPQCTLRHNGKKVSQAVLAVGDTLQVGRHELTLVWCEDEGPGPTPEVPRSERVLPRLASFAGRLLARRPARELVDHLLESMLETCGADCGFIATGPMGERRVVSCRGRAPSLDVADSIVERVLSAGAPVLVAEVEADAGLAQAPSVVALGVTSVVAVPLSLEPHPAALYLGRRAGRAPFSPADVDTALGLSALAALLLGASNELAALHDEVDRLSVAQPAAGYEGMLGDSPVMRELYRNIDRLGPTPLAVVIHGETGTGKELVARALHKKSRRRGRFVAVSCAALPDTLLERELFGHARGAFSGATQDRPGLFEAADGGTLFLDEVAELSPQAQVRLLRVTQEREVTRLGETWARKLDVRLIAASHRALDAEVAAGRFREDLRYRLDEVRLEVPALRDRGADIELIARAALRQAHTRAAGFTAKALEALQGYPFPGNVRELVSLIGRAALRCEGDRIGAELLELPARRIVPLEEAEREFVRRHVREAIAQCEGNKKEAAEALGIGLRSIFRYLEGP
ncbi:MAG: sigma 54-interacting transcriptional regulator [Myxococcaceae bacterium]|nr:sigma 54-interacting transcriptional regulator [Myxococcaceae bacterium]